MSPEKQMEQLLKTTWFGGGLIGGATFGMGSEHAYSRVWCLGDPDNRMQWAELYHSGITFGTPVMSVGFQLIFAFKIFHPNDFEIATADSSWSLSKRSKYGAFLEKVKKFLKQELKREIGAKNYFRLLLGKLIYDHRDLFDLYQIHVIPFELDYDLGKKLHVNLETKAGETQVTRVGYTDISALMDYLYEKVQPYLG